MTEFLFLMFLLTPQGDIIAASHQELLHGADRCQEMVEEARDVANSEGLVEGIDYTVSCVDSGLHPGPKTHS